MTNQSTIDKLIEMRLTTMADAFRNQLDDPKFKEVPFEDRFGMLVDTSHVPTIPAAARRCQRLCSTASPAPVRTPGTGKNNGPWKRASLIGSAMKTGAAAPPMK